MKKKALQAVIALTAIIAGGSSALAGYDATKFSQPKSTYDGVVKTADNYSYLAGASTSYNCLAYALDNYSTWIWPWGSSDPTSSQVDTYLSGKGYNTTTCGSSSDTKIISYGSTSASKHFGKPSDNNCVNLKWGTLERLQSLNWDPYSNTYYGARITDYKIRLFIKIEGCYP